MRLTEPFRLIENTEDPTADKLNYNRFITGVLDGSSSSNEFKFIFSDGSTSKELN